MAPSWSLGHIYSFTHSFIYLVVNHLPIHWDPLCRLFADLAVNWPHLPQGQHSPKYALHTPAWLTAFILSWVLYHPAPGCLGRDVGTTFESFFFSHHNPALLSAWICIRAPTSTICQEILLHLKCHKYSLVFGFPCRAPCLDLLIVCPGGCSSLLICLWTPVFLSPFCVMQPESFFFLKKIDLIFYCPAQEFLVALCSSQNKTEISQLPFRI